MSFEANIEAIRSSFEHMFSAPAPASTPYSSLAPADGGSLTNYGISGGTVRGVWKNGESAGMLYEGTKGCDMPSHYHAGCTEVIAVLKGRMMVVFDDTGETVVADAGEIIRIAPGRRHAMIPLEDVRALLVTIPPDQSYPEPAQ